MKTKLYVALTFATLTLGASGIAQAGTIFFDGFETPTSTGITYGGTDSAGAQFGNGTGLQSNGSAFGYSNAPEGVQTAHIQGMGSFTEDVFGLVEGQTYTLSFEDATRAGYGMDPISISYEPINGTDPLVVTTTPTSTAFSLVSQNFTYTGSSPLAEFTVGGTMPQTVGPNGDPAGDFNAAVDAFAISTASAVPEPATWLLMIAGIGGIGLMLRRARRTMGSRFKDGFAA